MPGYEDAALDDVYNKKGQLIKKMPHAEKVKFWNDVIAYAQDRGIDVWWYVWNIHVYGSEETKYGLTDSPDNATTKDYQFIEKVSGGLNGMELRQSETACVAK